MWQSGKALSTESGTHSRLKNVCYRSQAASLISVYSRLLTFSPLWCRGDCTPTQGPENQRQLMVYSCTRGTGTGEPNRHRQPSERALTLGKHLLCLPPSFYSCCFQERYLDFPWRTCSPTLSASISEGSLSWLQGGAQDLGSQPICTLHSVHHGHWTKSTWGPI